MPDHSPVDADFERMLETSKPTRELRWLLFALFLLLIGSAYQVAQQILAVGVTFTPRAQRWLLVIGLVGAGFLDLGVIAATWTAWGKQLGERLIQLPRCLIRLRWLSWLLFIVGILAFPILVLNLMGDLLNAVFPRLLVFWGFVFIGSVSLKALYPALSVRSAGITASSILAFVYHIRVLSLEVTDYPFSLSWSETSRFYLASLFAAEKIYGVQTPPSVLHPTRYLMQSIPFFVGDIPLWGHRLWQVILWVVCAGLAGYLLARRLKLGNRSLTAITAIWVYLSLFQGPVYYHLLVPVIVILGWFDPRKFWRGLISVILASAWAGISRVNWFPVPAMLAAVIYVLEEKQGDTPLWRYLIPPAVWGVVGVAAAFASQTGYVLLSGNQPEEFSSSFGSDLLWYRLLPNVTYPLGILFNVLVVSFPLLWAFAVRLWQDRENWSAIRVIGLWAATLALLAGGLVVSVKIGGGSNLHNMDAYLVLLIVVGGHLYFRRFAVEAGANRQAAYSWLMTLILVAIPVYMVVVSGAPLELPPSRVAAASLDAIHQHVNYAMRDGGEVLFISQRHLLYFDDQFDLPLVPEYEKVFFMEMVMSKNPDYLNSFYADLQSQRFAAIVSDQALEHYKGRDEAWSEEHNVWVQFVSRPLLCYYQPRLTLRVIHAQVLFPRPNVDECPIISENRGILANGSW
ncbi:MAG: hypothetical protein FJ010_10485 [Chloroflexi bacterium]|nr:hypothetical protein [Chloroflexota bacterium]